MKAKVIGISVLLLAAAAQAQAQPYYQAVPQHQAQRGEETSGPKATVVQGFGKLLAFLRRDQNLTPRTVATFLDREIAPYFDFEHMARWAAGPRYRGMGPRQRAAVEQELKEDFLTTLAQRLSGYSGQKVRFLPTRWRSDDQATVGVAIQNPGGYPSTLEFRLHRRGGGWKVLDIEANGSSAVMYYRQMFNRSWSPAPGRTAPYGRRG